MPTNTTSFKSQAKEYRPNGDIYSMNFRIDRSSPVPLYHQIEEMLRRAIRRRQIAPGESLPPEQELCATLGVSRSTVRRALANLVTAGLLRRERSKGTFVTGYLDSQEGVIEAFGIVGNEEAWDVAVGAETLSVEGTTVPADIGQQLGLPPDTAVLTVTRLYGDGDCPFALSYYYFGTAYRFSFAPAELDGSSFYAFLRQKCGIFVHRSTRVITAVAAGDALATLLDVGPGSPLLQVTGADYDEQGNKIGVTRTYFVPGTVDIRAALERTRTALRLAIRGTGEDRTTADF